MNDMKSIRFPPPVADEMIRAILEGRKTMTRRVVRPQPRDLFLFSLLGEVLQYNPDFDYHKERDWTTTLISDFNGTVQFVVEQEEGVYEEDTGWHKAGEKWADYSVHVVGHGVNKKTGKPINFCSSQTSL